MAINHACSVFDNVNVDIICALPRQNEHNLAKNLNEAISFPITHISCYELTYEKGTPLYNDTKNKNERDLELYQYTKFLLETAGFAQYEISNYAKPSFECAHNLAYWSNESYLGLGASAHSYDNEKKLRWANTKDLNKYLHKEFIDFTESAQDIDMLIMGLRKNKGLPLTTVPPNLSAKVKPFISKGLLQLNDGFLSYTDKGRMIENKILEDFLD
jgi:oxygen-independent coproporphyrinogen-3 oxidase